MVAIEIIFWIVCILYVIIFLINIANKNQISIQ